MLPTTLNLDSTSNVDVDGHPADLAIYQGDDYGPIAWRIQRKNSDGSLGAFIDLTGYTPKAQISPRPGQAATATFTVVLGDQVASPGLLTWSLTGTQTAGLDALSQYWDLQLTDPAGKVRTYLRGSVEIGPQVTT